jgi:hypothetical protein
LRWEVCLARDGPPSKTVKPRSARSFPIWGWVYPATDQELPKRGGHGVKAPIVDEGLDHEEVKVQEGQADR